MTLSRSFFPSQLSTSVTAFFYFYAEKIKKWLQIASNPPTHFLFFSLLTHTKCRLFIFNVLILPSQTAAYFQVPMKKKVLCV